MFVSLICFVLMKINALSFCKPPSVNSYLPIICIGDKIAIIFYPKCNHCKTIDWSFRNILILCHMLSRYKCRSSRPEVFLGKSVLKICSQCSKSCSENMQQIYMRTPMPKFDFNKATLHLFRNRTLAWVFSCKFIVYFQNTFS